MRRWSLWDLGPYSPLRWRRWGRSASISGGGIHSAKCSCGGTVVGLVLAFNGATGRSVRELRGDVAGLADEIATIRVVLERMLALLDARLPRERPTDHCVIALLLGFSVGVQLLGLTLLGVMAWQGRARDRGYQRELDDLLRPRETP